VVLRGISPMIWRRLLLRSDRALPTSTTPSQSPWAGAIPTSIGFPLHGKDYGVAPEGGIPFSDDPDQVYLADFGFRLRERFLPLIGQS
jgi:hypothetical protein